MKKERKEKQEKYCAQWSNYSFIWYVYVCTLHSFGINVISPLDRFRMPFKIIKVFEGDFLPVILLEMKKNAVFEAHLGSCVRGYSVEPIFCFCAHSFCTLWTLMHSIKWIWNSLHHSSTIFVLFHLFAMVVVGFRFLVPSTSTVCLLLLLQTFLVRVEYSTSSFS